MTLADLTRCAIGLQVRLFSGQPMPAIRLQWTQTVDGAVYWPRPRSVIALNVRYGEVEMSRWIASIVLHEMCHAVDCALNGAPPDGGWHRRTWRTIMRDRGLEPSPNLQGYSHSIIPDGPFDRIASELLRDR